MFGRVPHPDRRGFLKGAGLAAMGALVGAAIPFHRTMPAGFVPLAIAATEGRLPGKDGLIVLNDRPVNAETPAHLLNDDVTPTNRHFVRNNGIPPDDMDAESWRLTIDGLVDTPMTLSIADLTDRFEVVMQQLTIECGGNGRAFFEPPASSRTWSTPPTKGPTSTSRTTRTSRRYRPPERRPLRLVIPGWPGSCSQKWLTRVWLRDKVHDGAKMTGTSYRVPRYPVAPGTKVAKEDFVIIEAMPVRSLITAPESGITLEQRELAVHGHAWAGDDEVQSVELSIDFGATWTAADLAPPRNPYAWQNFSKTVTFPTPGYYEVWARATDGKGRAQPFAIAWNPKGYLNNSLFRVAVTVLWMRRLGILLSLLAVIVPAGAQGDDDEWDGLPPGPGREEVFDYCVACHSLAIVKQQGLSREAWDETLDWMVEEQGMPELDPEEHELVLDYLTHFYGPDRRAQSP